MRTISTVKFQWADVILYSKEVKDIASIKYFYHKCCVISLFKLFLI